LFTAHGGDFRIFDAMDSSGSNGTGSNGSDGVVTLGDWSTFLVATHLEKEKGKVGRGDKWLNSFLHTMSSNMKPKYIVGELTDAQV